MPAARGTPQPARSSTATISPACCPGTSARCATRWPRPTSPTAPTRSSSTCRARQRITLIAPLDAQRPGRRDDQRRPAGGVRWAGAARPRHRGAPATATSSRSTTGQTQLRNLRLTRGDVVVADNASVNFEQTTGSATFAEDISGDGSLKKEGGGALRPDGHERLHGWHRDPSGDTPGRHAEHPGRHRCRPRSASTTTGSSSSTRPRAAIPTTRISSARSAEPAASRRSARARSSCERRTATRVAPRSRRAP